MSEAVDLGSIFSNVELRLGAFNISVGKAMAAADTLERRFANLKLDPAGMLNGLNKVTTELRSLQAQAAITAKETQASLNSIKFDGAAVSGGARAATFEVRGIGMAADSANKSLGRVRFNGSGVNGAASTAARNVNQIGIQAARAQAALGRVSFNPNGVIAGANRAQAAINRVNQAAARANVRPAAGRAAGRGMGGMGGGYAGMMAGGLMTGAGLALLAPLAASVKTGAEFEDMVQHLYATAGETMPLQKLRSALLGIAETYGQMPSEVAKGLYPLASAGFKGADGLKILAQTANFAKGNSVALSDATALVTKTLYVYQLGANDAARVTDIYTKSVKDALVPAAEYVPALANVLTVGKNAGLSLEELNAALGILTHSTKSAATGSTYLKNFIQGLITPTHAMKEAAKAAGLAWLAAGEGAQHIKSVGFPAVLNEIERATNGNVTALGKLFPDMRKNQAIMALLSDGGVRASKALDDISHSAGATSAASKEMDQSIGQAGRNLDAQLAVAGTHIEDDLKPTLLSLAKTIGNVLDAFNKLSPATQSFAVYGAAAAGVILAVSGNVLTLISTVAMLKVAFGGAAVAQGGMAAGGLSLFAKAGPYMLLLAAVAAAVLLIKRDWDAAAESANDYAASASKDKATAAGYATLGKSTNPTTQLELSRRKASDALTNVNDELARNKAMLAAPGRWGGGPLGRAGTEARDTKLAADAITLKNAIAGYDKQIKEIGANTGHAVPAAVLKSIAAGIETPEAKATCALFASKMLAQLGANVPVIAGAKALRDYAVSHGAQQIPNAQAQAGDLVVWQGARYGAKQAGARSGFHTGIALGGGMVTQSSDGVKSNQTFYDQAHATVYRMPGIGVPGSVMPTGAGTRTLPPTSGGAEPAWALHLGGSKSGSKHGLDAETRAQYTASIANATTAGEKAWDRAREKAAEMRAAGDSPAVIAKYLAGEKAQIAAMKANIEKRGQYAAMIASATTAGDKAWDRALEQAATMRAHGVDQGTISKYLAGVKASIAATSAKAAEKLQKANDHIQTVMAQRADHIREALDALALKIGNGDNVAGSDTKYDKLVAEANARRDALYAEARRVAKVPTGPLPPGITDAIENRHDIDIINAQQKTSSYKVPAGVVAPVKDVAIEHDKEPVLPANLLGDQADSKVWAEQYKLGTLAADKYIAHLKELQPQIVQFYGKDSKEALALATTMSAAQNDVYRADVASWQNMYNHKLITAQEFYKRLKAIRDDADRAEKTAIDAKMADLKAKTSVTLGDMTKMVGDSVTRNIETFHGLHSFWRGMWEDMKKEMAHALAAMVGNWIANLGKMQSVGGPGGGGAQGALSPVKSMMGQMQNLFKGFHQGLAADIAGLYGAAAMMGALGKKKQKHSWLGAILGGVAGSFFGMPLQGAEYGSAIGGMFAKGGRPPVGMPSIVGENGPELFVPDSSGRIIPNDQLGGKPGPGGGANMAAFHAMMTGGAPAPQITINHHGDINNQAGENRSAETLAWAVHNRMAVSTI